MRKFAGRQRKLQHQCNVFTDGFGHAVGNSEYCRRCLGKPSDGEPDGNRGSSGNAGSGRFAQFADVCEPDGGDYKWIARGDAYQHGHGVAFD